MHKPKIGPILGITFALAAMTGVAAYSIAIKHAERLIRRAAGESDFERRRKSPQIRK